jgi:hypothetical protein
VKSLTCRAPIDPRPGRARRVASSSTDTMVCSSRTTIVGPRSQPRSRPACARPQLHAPAPCKRLGLLHEDVTPLVGRRESPRASRAVPFRALRGPSRHHARSAAGVPADGAPVVALVRHGRSRFSSRRRPSPGAAGVREAAGSGRSARTSSPPNWACVRRRSAHRSRRQFRVVCPAFCGVGFLDCCAA